MNSDHYISLIYKELKGIISPEEAKDLRAWEKQSSENQVTVEEIRQVWIESEHYELPFELDHDTDFAKMKSSITTSKTSSKVVPIRPRRLWFRVAAAAVIVLLGATFLFRNSFQNEIKWEIVESNSEIKELQLADGSKIWLNVGSTLSYPAEFSSTERPIKLNGEAFFEVAKDVNRPFQVTTDRTTVTVLGTEFNVRDIAAEKTFEVAVQEGKVRVQKNQSSQKVILVKNENAFYNEKNDSLEKVNDKNLNAISWKRKSLKFQNTALKDALSTLQNQYKISINLKNKSLEKCPISGRYKTTTPIFELLKDLTSNQKIKVKKLSETAYELIGGACE